MFKRVAGLAMGLFLLAAGNLSAQVAWDAPLLVAPQAGSGTGILLMEAAAGDVGVMGTWRTARGAGSLGFRVGIAEDWRGDVGVFGGVDFAGAITRANRDFPLDVSWIVGGGLGIGDDLFLAFPFGISAGHTFKGDGVDFTPYLSPRVILDAYSWRDFRGDRHNDLELNFAADIGLDIGFQQGWTIRFGLTFGDLFQRSDRDALAIGIVF